MRFLRRTFPGLILGTLLVLIACGPGTAVLMPALAVGVDPPMEDPAQEARARAIAKDLRCLVCQNQSIEESDAPLAADLRQLVRERIAEGDDDQAVKDFVVARFGDWVLLRPPFRPATWVLWLAPSVIFGVGLVLAWVWLGRRRAAAEPEPLSAAEERAIARLIDGGEGKP